MPSGKAHDTITLTAAAASGPLWWHFAPEPKDWTAGVVYLGALLFSGLALSPVLDLDSSVYRRWGVFRWLWWPYQRLVRHRSWISHSFLFGPLLRTLYFLAFVFLLFRLSSWVVDYFLVPVDRNGLSRQWAHALLHLWHTHPLHCQMLLLGLLLGAALHVSADMAVTAFKRSRRRP